MELPMDIEKPKKECAKCKKSGEVNLQTNPFTKDEMDRAMEICNKRTMSPQEQAWFYNLYNRVFKTNKMPGCGKCLGNNVKQLKIRYNELYNR